MPKIRLDDLIKYQGDNEIVKKVVKLLSPTYGANCRVNI